MAPLEKTDPLLVCVDADVLIAVLLSRTRAGQLGSLPADWTSRLGCARTGIACRSAATHDRAGEELALFEVQGSNIRADKFDSIAVENGVVYWTTQGNVAADGTFALTTIGLPPREGVVPGHHKVWFEMPPTQRPRLTPGERAEMSQEEQEKWDARRGAGQHDVTLVPANFDAASAGHLRPSVIFPLPAIRSGMWSVAWPPGMARGSMAARQPTVKPTTCTS